MVPRSKLCFLPNEGGSTWIAEVFLNVDQLVVCNTLKFKKKLEGYLDLSDHLCIVLYSLIVNLVKKTLKSKVFYLEHQCTCTLTTSHLGCLNSHK